MKKRKLEDGGKAVTRCMRSDTSLFCDQSNDDRFASCDAIYEWEFVEKSPCKRCGAMNNGEWQRHSVLWSWSMNGNGCWQFFSRTFPVAFVNCAPFLLGKIHSTAVSSVDEHLSVLSFDGWGFFNSFTRADAAIRWPKSWLIRKWAKKVTVFRVQIEYVYTYRT